MVGVRLLPPILDPLDAWIASQADPKPSRPEAIRHLLSDSLTGLGFMKHRDDPEGAN